MRAGGDCRGGRWEGEGRRAFVKTAVRRVKRRARHREWKIENEERGREGEAWE